MGALCSSVALTETERAENEHEKRMARMIDDELVKSRKSQSNILKLLLLGTGESGKSTLFKQLIHLWGKGFDTQARQPYASIVFTNCILGMKTLVKQSDVLDTTLETRISPALTPSKVYILNEAKPDGDIDEDVARHIKLLWADPGIQNAFKHRSLFQLSDSLKYFYEKIDEIASPGYIPNLQDVLHCRARTTGIVETSFDIEQNRFTMVDVGGQRNERKKWIHCFEGVTAVIFVSAINEYDQVLYEDGLTNRLTEALDLFADICNSRWFRETSMILFLNKLDLFAEKIQTVDLGQYFSHYKGGCNYDKAIEFIANEFLSRNEYPDRKQVYVHFTCATDTANVQFTFSVVKDIIIKGRLKECGLLE